MIKMKELLKIIQKQSEEMPFTLFIFICWIITVLFFIIHN